MNTDIAAIPVADPDLMTAECIKTETSTGRVLAIDRFRGLAVVLMVVGGFIGQLEKMPELLKHPQTASVWFTLADLVAPLFIFAIGLTFGLSYNKRKQQKGRKAAIAHGLMRGFALIGIGALTTALENVVSEGGPDWGVFQAIGVACILLLIVVELPVVAKLCTATVLLTISHLLLSSVLSHTAMPTNHGGVVGTLSWGAMLIYADCFATLFFKNKKEYALLLIAFAAATAAVWLFVDKTPSKITVSLGYNLFVTTLSAAGFFALNLISAKYNRPFDPLSWWGRNALLLYFANGILVEFALGMLLPPIFWKESPLYFALPLAAVIAVLFTVAAWYLNKKKLYIKI